MENVQYSVPQQQYAVCTVMVMVSMSPMPTGRDQLLHTHVKVAIATINKRYLPFLGAKSTNPWCFDHVCEQKARCVDIEKHVGLQIQVAVGGNS